MKLVWKVTGILFGILAVILFSFVLLINFFFFNTNRLPQGEFMTEAESPNGDYTAKIYLADGGATVTFAVRGEIIYHKKKDKKKNIYWQYREERTEIIWVDDHIVSINGIELDVRKDVYDWRKSK